MRNPLRTLRGTKNAIEVATHADEVEFLGRCWCGDPACEGWIIKFRDRHHRLAEKEYDKLRFLKEIKK